MSGPAAKVFGSRSFWLLAPSVAGIGALFLLPLGLLIFDSFTSPTVGIGNYVSVLTDALVWRVLGITFEISATVTLICLLIGYCAAYSLMIASARTRRLMFFFILVPFWTSTLIKTYAWVIILSRRGVINDLIAMLHIPEQSLIYNRTGTTIGMVYIMLPYMILSLYPVISAIDRRLLDASASLGARDTEGFLRIFLPLSAPGVLAGCLLVLILSVGFFITPALLGSPKDLMISVYIDVQVERLLDWGVATSASVILLVITLILTFMLRKLAIRNAGAI